LKEVLEVVQAKMENKVVEVEGVLEVDPSNIPRLLEVIIQIEMGVLKLNQT
jgi:hypothetical protein